MKKFAVFDIDGTLIRWQLYHALADALVRLGYIAPKSFESVKAARMLWKQRADEASFIKYESQLIKEFDRIIANLKVGAFNEAVDAVFHEYKDQVYTYSRDFIKELKSKDYLLFAISGSQIEIVGKIAKYYGFTDCVGSQYVQADGKFSGKKILTLGSKHLILKDLAQKHGAGFKGSIAVGDSESDITMLEMVDKPIVFNPTKKLFEYAKKRRWPIVLERKNVIYKLQKAKRLYKLI